METIDTKGSWSWRCRKINDISWELIRQKGDITFPSLYFREHWFVVFYVFNERRGVEG